MIALIDSVKDADQSGKKRLLLEPFFNSSYMSLLNIQTDYLALHIRHKIITVEHQSQCYILKKTRVHFSFSSPSMAMRLP